LKRVDMFPGPVAFGCSGAASLRRQEERFRLDIIIRSLRRGEDELAHRLAFSVRQVTPAIAVDGDPVCLGEVPEPADFLRGFGLKRRS
jgi:hypothetical protein